MSGEGVRREWRKKAESGERVRSEWREGEREELVERE